MKGFIEVTVERTGFNMLLSIDEISCVGETKEKRCIIFFKDKNQSTVFETYDQIKSKIEDATK